MKLTWRCGMPEAHELGPELELRAHGQVVGDTPLDERRWLLLREELGALGEILVVAGQLRHPLPDEAVLVGVGYRRRAGARPPSGS